MLLPPVLGKHGLSLCFEPDGSDVAVELSGTHPVEVFGPRPAHSGEEPTNRRNPQAERENVGQPIWLPFWTPVFRQQYSYATTSW